MKIHLGKQQYLKLLTFIFGFALVILGFFVDNLKEFSGVARIFFPDAYYLNEALVHLDSKKDVHVGDPSFKYVIKRCAPPDFDSTLVTSFTKGTTTYYVTSMSRKPDFGIHARIGELTSERPICNSQALEVSEDKILLYVGLLISIVGFLIK
ncbi:MAG: hypothetical protein AB202_00360 [Parcubacteria bacterium C7867-007]|nr:MAG: hypothetical protein AB202_00360 [Parcubacteria bacterium C7867-007]